MCIVKLLKVFRFRFRIINHLQKEFDLIFRHSNILCPLFLLGECISHSMDCVGRSKSSRDGVPFQIQLLTK